MAAARPLRELLFPLGKDVFRQHPPPEGPGFGPGQQFVDAAPGQQRHMGHQQRPGDRQHHGQHPSGPQEQHKGDDHVGRGEQGNRARRPPGAQAPAQDGWDQRQQGEQRQVGGQRRFAHELRRDQRVGDIPEYAGQGSVGGQRGRPRSETLLPATTEATMARRPRQAGSTGCPSRRRLAACSRSA